MEGEVITGMGSELVTEITTGLTGYGETILEYTVDLLPALATLAAIFFVIRIIKKKVKA